MATPDHNPRIQDILKRLSTLDVEKNALRIELAELEKQRLIVADVATHLTKALSPDEKIEIFGQPPLLSPRFNSFF